MGVKEVERRADARPGSFDYGQKDSSGQYQNYPVLKAEERAKGFVRPLYRAYKHVGRPICGDTSDTDHSQPSPGKIWACSDKPGHEGEHESWMQVTPAEAKRGVKGGCGTVTTMGLALCETYARQPSFYGSTFCSRCGDHFPVGSDGEFIWVADQQNDNQDTNLRVGE